MELSEGTSEYMNHDDSNRLFYKIPQQRLKQNYQVIKGNILTKQFETQFENRNKQAKKAKQ